MKMPVLFVGHGSPMNALTDNPYKDEWIRLGEKLKPEAILCVSAHWYTKGTYVNPTREPEQIYDMYGFPQELYQIRYPAKGSPELAARVGELLGEGVATNTDWGIDHGTWSVLKWMFPDADIPIVQLSIDGTRQGAFHYGIGQQLRALRAEGVLIIGSGNIVHNLRRVDWDSEGGTPWAYEFDGLIRRAIEAGRHEQVIDHQVLGDSAKLAVPTPDHFYPLLYVLGAAEVTDQVHCFNEACELGSISMTGYLLAEDISSFSR